jgi:hypothetical protein
MKESSLMAILTFKHGYGIFYDAAQQSYFNAEFNNDVFVRWGLKQGYASDEDSEKMTHLLEILNSMNPSKIIDPHSDEHEAYFEKMEIPEEPLLIPSEK